MKTFSGKIAVVTGAGSGLGRSFALQLNALGARLALCDKDFTSLEETLKIMGENGDHIRLHQIDVSEREQMTQFAYDVLSQHGAADILINNAGISLTPLRFDEITDEQFEKVLNINMWGVHNGVRAFLPQLHTRPEASIVNVSSLAGLVGLYGYSAYSMSKFAMRGFSEALQSELAGSNVHLLIVHPGGVKTNIIKHAPNLPEDQREEAHNSFSQYALLNADQTVIKILRAVKKKKKRLILGADAHLVYALRTLFPQNYPKLIQVIFSQAMFQKKSRKT